MNMISCHCQVTITCWSLIHWLHNHVAGPIILWRSHSLIHLQSVHNSFDFRFSSWTWIRAKPHVDPWLHNHVAGPAITLWRYHWLISEQSVRNSFVVCSAHEHEFMPSHIADPWYTDCVTMLRGRGPSSPCGSLFGGFIYSRLVIDFIPPVEFVQHFHGRQVGWFEYQALAISCVQ